MPNYYAVAIEHDNEAEYERILPEPFSEEGIKRPSRINTMDGGTVSNGYKTDVLIWDVLSDEERVEILDLYGLSEDNPTSDVTHSLRDNDGSFIDVNATAIYDQNERRMPPLGWIDFTITILKIVEI